VLFRPHGGTVVAYDLMRRPGLGAHSHVPIGGRLELGGGYSIERVKSDVHETKQGGTEILREAGSDSGRLTLVGGHGSAARVFQIGDAPVSVGAEADNAIVLTDRAVSRHHCRFEPSSAGVSVRDLGSTNGTWVDGIRIRRHLLRPGAVIRIGRTTLRAAGLANAKGSGTGLVAGSPAMLSVLAQVDRFSMLPWPVLVCGETGVGKERVARALHERGPRAKGPFVPLNGGGLPRELIESELFGHERGAFTGAVQAHRGAFEQAHGGTLFLDEIAELPPDLQTRLLRVLETWQVRRVGSESARRVDVRLVCATHRDLRALVDDAQFRADLYYRIHRLVIEVPPLRTRPEEVPALANHFLTLMQPEIGTRTLEPDALERLRRHRWRGNIRELRNVLELAAVDCDGAVIDVGAIDRSLRRGSRTHTSCSGNALRETLEQYGGNMAATARALGIPRSTLRDRLKAESGAQG
jgi:transcriptional regulator with GAF, ATPase, and Fis domain